MGGAPFWRGSAAPVAAQTGLSPAELLAAASKEGTAVWHTSIDLPVAQNVAGLFNARFPQVRIQLERSGAERVLQRITQEYASGIKVADVVESSDAAMFVDFKQVKPEDAPTSFVDLLHPRWRLRMVKAYLGYSGTIINATFTTAAGPTSSTGQTAGAAGTVGDRSAEDAGGLFEFHMQAAHCAWTCRKPAGISRGTMAIARIHSVP